MKNLRSCLYKGHIGHMRDKPVVNHFRYSIFSFFIDLDELNTLAKQLKLFSYQQFNLFSFREKDHFKFTGRDRQKTLKQSVVDYIHQIDKKIRIDRVCLLTNVRIWGYTFNPVSFYYCYDNSDKLTAILAEVNNTFLEQKAYLVRVKDNKARSRQQKNFYVSPFIDYRHDFNFIFTEPGETLNIIIDSEKERDKILKAYVRSKREELTNWRLFVYLFKFPFYTFKVILAIHYQALKLLLKKVTYFEKEKSDQELEKVSALNKASKVVTR